MQGLCTRSRSIKSLETNTERMLNMDPIKNKPEKMEEFFDVRADSYDDHMLEYVDDYESFYRAVAEPIAKTNKKIKLLNLGCGTGLELEYIFAKVPNAMVTGIDLSQQMLDLLLDKYKKKSEQIETIRESYLDIDFKRDEYDYIVSKDKEAEMLAEYKEELKKNKVLKDDLYHLDIPFSIKTQKNLFEKVGFTDFELIFSGDETGVYSAVK